MGRGIERKKIFTNDTDRNDFIDRLAGLAEEGAMDVYAWVLMPNHFHILCKTHNRPFSSSMRKVLTGYVVNFNRRHRRYGHLFQNRYKSIVCQEDRYLKELVHYFPKRMSFRQPQCPGVKSTFDLSVKRVKVKSRLDPF